MTQLYKLTLSAGAAAAGTIEGALAVIDAPEALAVSRFEDGRGGWTVEAYYAEAEALSTLAPVLMGVGLAAAPVFVAVPDEDWVGKVEATLSPVHAGRFVVYGPHDRKRIAEHPYAIEIEACGAFGTAHHQTTQGCLSALDQVLSEWPARRVLDLGTGTGVLAIAAAMLLPEAVVIASDIDAAAIEIARDNMTKNGLDGRIEFIVAESLDDPHLSAPQTFNLIIANILAEPLIKLAPRIAGALDTGGQLILSGLLKDQAEAVTAAYDLVGMQKRDEILIGDWSTLILELNATPAA